MDLELSPWRTRAYAELSEPLATVLGERTAKPFRALNVETVGDLLRHLPRRYLSGTDLTDLATLAEGEHVAVIARVVSVDFRQARGNGKRRLEVVLSDGHGRLNVTFFGKDHLLNWWAKQLGLGVAGVFIGKVGRFRDDLQMTHPIFAMLDASGQVVGTSEDTARTAQLVQSGMVGMYPATGKLPTWTIAECARLALDSYSGDDPWPEWVRVKAGVPPLADAFAQVHAPATAADAAAGARRLLFDEAFATQLTMAYRRHDAALNNAVPRPRRDGGILAAFDKLLPFELTAGQQQVGEEIFADLTRPRPMQRLLQGEVGSGKTLVALRAMLAVVDNGGQAALLAPTEVLANQHFNTIKALLGELGQGRMLGGGELATDVVLLTGSATAVAKRNAMLRAASGEAGIVVGTHALLSDKVQFADLGLLVIDEQHRFGVEQRALLADKAAERPHTLVLTATPIPRSVAMTVFGDLEVSTLTEIPAGRADVSTVVVDARNKPAWLERAWQRVREEVATGRQVFIVGPRIASGQGLGVEELAAHLASGPLRDVPLRVLHGQLSAEEKQSAMEDFNAGKVGVLVATTMIEVGVDVPNASMMVIWEAERFGISQLHQLRGRIGRGQYPGVCLLVTETDDPAARERLDAVAATRDGFALAELDLAQRREGDVLGASQSGSRSSLRLLRVLEHADIIAAARELAEAAVAKDPDCATPGFQDAVRATELLSGPDWMDRS
ncbi:MAG: ATP-dependent DNA helicase RecG [Propionibacteriaceae bacterium]|nr:ATP-dependent DNA helicase RecG [Propionibacteriaceae bacterium]